MAEPVPRVPPGESGGRVKPQVAPAAVTSESSDRTSGIHTRVETFTLAGYSGTRTSGIVTIQAFDRTRRWRRALQGLGKWWGVALLSVFIPIAHFVLVPSFLLYGVWQGVQRLGTTEVARDARGTCPDCGQDQVLELASRWHTPQSVTCRRCRRSLQLSLAAADP